MMSTIERLKEICNSISEFDKIYFMQQATKIHIMCYYNPTVSIKFTFKNIINIVPEIVDIFATKKINKIEIASYDTYQHEIINMFKYINYLQINSELNNSIIEDLICNNCITKLNINKIVYENIELLSILFDKNQLKEINIPRMDDDILPEFLNILIKCKSITTINYYSMNKDDYITDDIYGNEIYMDINTDHLIKVLQYLLSMSNVKIFNIENKYIRKASIDILFNTITNTSVEILNCSKIILNADKKYFKNTSGDEQNNKLIIKKLKSYKNASKIIKIIL